MARLIIRTPLCTRFIELTQQTMTIGRSRSANDIAVPEETGASRQHCRLERRGRLFCLTDLSSRNGTYLDGEAVGQAVLPMGSHFKIGKTRFTLDEPPTGASGWLQPGTFVDGWLIKQRLGSGARSEVYEAVRFKPREQVALKLFDGPAPERGQRIPFPGLVPFLGSEFWERGEYWVLGLVQGEDLANRQKRGQLRSREGFALASQLLIILHRLHSAGLVHGRLRPANVLFDRQGQVYLTDGEHRPGNATRDMLQLAKLLARAVAKPSVEFRDFLMALRVADRADDALVELARTQVAPRRQPDAT